MAPSMKRKRSARPTTWNPSSRRSTPLISLARPSLVRPPPARNIERSIDLATLGDDTESEQLDHVIAAIDIKQRGTVGCAYYVAREERLFCMEDVVQGSNDIVDVLKIDIQPTALLVSVRVNSEGLDAQAARQGSMVDDNASDGRPPLPYQIDYRPPQDFSYEGAKNKLSNLQSVFEGGANMAFLVPGESAAYDHGQEFDEFGSTSCQGKLLRLSGWINLDSQVSVGCVGAVLTYLQRKRSAEYLQDDPDAQQAYRVTSIEMFSLKGTMFINADTLLSLQIIQPESHPNPSNQGPGSTGAKESLSIFGLFHHLARTPQGKTRLRQFFLRPSLDIDEINTRKLSNSLSKVKNMRTTMTLLHKGINGGNQKFGGFKSGVWATLLELAYHTIDIRDTLREVLGAENLPIRARAMEVLDSFQLQRIGRMIHDIVDLDLSIEQHRTVVKRGVEARLDEVKNVYDGMDQLLSRTAIEIARTIPPEVDTNLNVIYFPQLGFHITLPINEATGQPVYEGGEEPWERMFTTQSQVYFKDRRMHEMDEQLGDLYAIICDIEIEISHELAQNVLKDEEMLVAVSEFCGELDSLLALAQGASRYKLTKPRITKDNVVEIRGGRHLLQELMVASYVPNDAYLVGGKDSSSNGKGRAQSFAEPEGPSMLLLTGPNYSGKSVYQKQVALTVFLAHIGSFVPAEAATIGLTDKILTRITTRETVSKIQSAFMIDLQQIAQAINQASPRSLVIIDEFGKGTDSCDGAGLAAGVFKHLLSLGDAAPKVLAATHFHEIFEHGYLKPQAGLAFAHMEVLVDRKGKRKAGDTATEVTYLYNLCPGRSVLSYGTQCAAQNGIPTAVVARADELAARVRDGEDLVAVCAAMSPEEEEDLEDAENAARAFLGCDFETEAEPKEALGSVLGETATTTVS